MELCKKLLITPTLALSVDEKKIKDDVEWGREYDELRILKEVNLTISRFPGRRITKYYTFRLL